MNERRTEASGRDAPDGEARRERRLRWSAPRITAHGSLRHLVRGATGPYGDPGTPVGKRQMI